MPDLTLETHRMCRTNEFWERRVRGSRGDEYMVRFEAVHGPQRAARMCDHDFTCTCQHFQLRRRLRGSGYCKHIEQVRTEHCGWHGCYGGGLEPPSLTSEEAGLAAAEGRCPCCGGETVSVRVAV